MRWKGHAMMPRAWVFVLCSLVAVPLAARPASLRVVDAEGDVAGPVLGPTSHDPMYLIEADALREPRSTIDAQSFGFDHPSSICLTIPDAVDAYPVVAWPFVDFNPPFRVELDPFLFGDDFSSADLEAWSSANP
jgi:hypothetical protein